MIKYTKKTLVAVFFIFCLVVGLYLRLEGIPAGSWFGGDQGMYLIMAREIVKHGRRPLVGSVLSVKNFFSPPTWFYLMALFYSLVKVDYIVFFFLIMNLLGIVVLSRLMYKLFDFKTAVVTSGLMLLSSQMIWQSKNIWSPYPLFLLLSLSFWWLYKAGEKNRLKELIYAMVAFGLALSIYPSPILLVFFYLKHVYGFFKKRYADFKSLVLSLGLMLGIVGLIFLPQLIFEIKFQWPSLTTIGPKTFFMLPVVGFIKELINNFILSFQLMYPFTLEKILMLNVSLVGLSLIFLGLDLKKRKGNKKGLKAVSFLSLKWVFAGMLFTPLYRLEMRDHRFLALLPVFFLLLALIIYQFWLSKQIYLKLIPLVMILGFILVNLNGLHNLDPRINNDLQSVRQTAKELVEVIKSENIDNESFFVDYLDINGKNYAQLAYVYWLGEYIDYPIILNTYGNYLASWEYYEKRLKRVFLVCDGFKDLEQEKTECLDKYVEGGKKINPRLKGFLLMEIYKPNKISSIYSLRPFWWSRL